MSESKYKEEEGKNLKEIEINDIKEEEKGDHGVPVVIGLNRMITIQAKEEEKHGESLIDKALHYSFFLFINSGSGGNEAGQFLKLEAEMIQFILDHQQLSDSTNNNLSYSQIKRQNEVDVYFYELPQKQSREKGLINLRETQQKRNSNVRCIVCGGDGTIMWVISLMSEFKIDFENCPIGIVPFGTGNDFARVLGWGGSAPSVITGQNLVGTKSLVQKWINSLILEFDIWDIEVSIYDDGLFKRIEKRDGQAVQVIMEELDPQTGKMSTIKVIKQSMSNYMSVGIDARIGLGFDRHRTQSATGNQIVYCWEGFKKMFLTTKQVNNVIDSLEELHNQDIIDNEVEHMGVNIEDVNKKTKVAFCTRDTEQEKQKKVINPPQPQNKQQEGEIKSKENKGNQYLKGNPATLIILNVNSYSGGCIDMWEASQNKVGLQGQDKQTKIDDAFDHQNFGDGKLEFISFESSTSLANERFFKGRGHRVAQGSGPFSLKFKKEEAGTGMPIRTYFQIDGEFYQIISPQEIQIKLTEQLPRGKVQVMMQQSSQKEKK